MRPKYCSLNFTCELNRNITVQCNAHAHFINDIFMRIFPCDDLNDCYSQFAFRTKALPDTIEKNEILNLKSSETVPLFVNQNYVVFCSASNEMGRSTAHVIIFASDIESGRLIKVENFGERKDNDTVEGDSMSIRFTYNYQLYDKLNYSLPSDECQYKIEEEINSKNYSKSLKFIFPSVSLACAKNYTYTIFPRNHPYLNKTVRNWSYLLNVLKAEEPGFIMDFNLPNGTLTPVDGSSRIDYFSESDETISFNCLSNGRPRPEIKWFKDNILIDLNDIKYEVGSKGILTVLRVHSSDSGLYKCIVSNRFNTIERYFNLSVKKNEIITNKLSKNQIMGIIAIVITSVILFALLIAAIVYVCIQHQKHKRLKNELKRILEMILDGDEVEFDQETLINTKLENLKKLKFDESRWQIEPKKFIIYEDRVLGEGEFGKVCLALVSFKADLRSDDEVNDISKHDQANRGIRRHFSFRSKNNPYSGNSTLNDKEVQIPLIRNNGGRLVAVKMVKGMF